VNWLRGRFGTITTRFLFKIVVCQLERRAGSVKPIGRAEFDRLKTLNKDLLRAPARKESTEAGR
jgi:hypothetical protein